jgi:hypothetical protein
MKLILALVFFLTSASTFAQCDKSVTLTSSHIYFTDSTGKSTGDKEGTVTVQLSKGNIIITPSEDENEVMTGKIKDKTCNWTVPYKEGKMIIKSDLLEAGGRMNSATIIIEGKKGIMTVTAVAAEFPNRKIIFTVDKYQEIN